MALQNDVSTKLSMNVMKQTVKATADLAVLRWGEVFGILLGGQIALVNTCPIDNFFTIFYVLIKQHTKFARHLSTSTESYARILIDRIVKMFDNGYFAEGKCEWLKLFPGRFNLEQPGQINLWGNEELFVSRTMSTLESTFTSTCPSKHCPSRVEVTLFTGHKT